MRRASVHNPAIVAAKAGGVCPSTGTVCNPDIDFNNDGLFPDTLDVESFVWVFGGGACL